MLAYIRSEYLHAQQKLTFVRDQCLNTIHGDSTLSGLAAVSWQLKPREIECGLWQGRLLEAEADELEFNSYR